MVKQTSLLTLFLSLIAFSCVAEKLTFRQEQKSPSESHIFVDYALAPKDALFKDSLNFSLADPTYKITSWENEQSAVPMYDSSFKTTKQSYTGKGSFKITIEKNTPSSPSAQLYVHYRLKSSDEPQEEKYTIAFNNKSEPKKISAPASSASTEKSEPVHSIAKSIKMFFGKIINKLGQNLAHVKSSVSNLVSHTESTALRLFFVFLLGLLMSLTPCIYPMIPVTVGILQTTASNSLARNFMLALSYTIGIAMTFAILGLLAASGSAHFGALMGNPYFVVFLVAFLGYLAFSMLGFYDMYTPKFMQTDTAGSADGSFASAFIFGAISGSVASPCLSPGLLLLLSIVATMGSKLLGFIYLFIFGLGLGLPLLIICTFSNSMNVMPRAGLWMVEVKKLFGFMLLSMCFYYLSNILPWYILLWAIGFTILCSGLLYLSTIESYYSKSMRWFKQITGTALVCIGFLVFFQAYKATVTKPEATLISHWNHNYHQAREQALAEKKLMLVDFGATWCTLCNEIEHKLLHHPLVKEKLQNIVMVKIDCTNPSAESCAAIQDKFTIIGFPALLLVEPNTETVVSRWGGELGDTSPEQFVALVQLKQD